ncbi:spondin domain-containing protein [Patescibacteria group bacterium]
MSKTLVIAIIIIFIIGIGYWIFMSSQMSPTEENKEEVSNENIKENEFKATYKIDFIAQWSEQTHTNNYPKGAHFSPFVAYSHNNSVEAKIFVEGQDSSLGMEEMAETGKTTKLNQEIDQIISSKRAFQKTQGSVFDSPGNNSAELQFNKDNKYVTFVSMLAPSPDWFVAQTKNLIENGKWLESIELELITYDAGSDSGSTLTAEDIDTNPKEPITVFSENLQRLGKIILTKIE